MALTYEDVSDLSTTVILIFDKAYEGAPSVYQTVCSTIESKGESNTYPFGDTPEVREFLGARVNKSLVEYQYTLFDRTWESTLEIPRKKIEDDNLSFYKTLAAGMGKTAKGHIDILFSEALMKAFATGMGYDGVPFFSDQHPGGKDEAGGDLPKQSNFQDGTGEPWFLIDDTKVLSPFIFQNRIPTKMEVPTGLSETTFKFNMYEYGTYGRYAIGYGLWQCAFASKAPLTKENYEAAVLAMNSIKKENGYAMAINPTKIIVGPKNKAAAKSLFNAENIGGSSNIYYKDVEIVTLLYLSAPAGTRKIDSSNNVIATLVADNGATKTVKVGDIEFVISFNQLRDDSTLTAGGLEAYNLALLEANK